MKTNIYRLTLIGLVTCSIGLSSYFLYIFCITNPEYAPKLLTILATVILLIISLFEVYALIKGINKEKIIIHDLVYEGQEINKGPLVINNIFLFFGLGFIITFTTLVFLIPKYLNIYYFFIELGVYLSINCMYYDFYIRLHKSEEKEKLRLIGRY